MQKNNVKKNRKKRDKREEIIKNDNNFFFKKWTKPPQKWNHFRIVLFYLDVQIIKSFNEIIKNNHHFRNWYPAGKLHFLPIVIVVVSSFVLTNGHTIRELFVWCFILCGNLCKELLRWEINYFIMNGFNIARNVIAINLFTLFNHQLTLLDRIPLRRGVLDTTLCEEAYRWFAAGRWFSPGIPPLLKNWLPWYNWNIVEQGVTHCNPNHSPL